MTLYRVDSVTILFDCFLNDWTNKISVSHHTLYDERIAKEVQRKNDTLKEIFNRLKKENEKNIIFISSKNMLGEDGEATIDGIHFTDLGMMRYADLVCPIIKKAIK